MRNNPIYVRDSDLAAIARVRFNSQKPECIEMAYKWLTEKHKGRTVQLRGSRRIQ